MNKFVFRMEVRTTTLPERINWLGDFDSASYEDEFPEESYELYFNTFEEMSKKIDQITEGCHQYWANVRDDMYGNNVEDLEYHNGYGTWDKEIDIETSRLYLVDSLLKAIENNTRDVELLTKPVKRQPTIEPVRLDEFMLKEKKKKN